MSAFSRLPEELLDAITIHLTQADVSSLGRTCKALWHSMDPRLFRVISMKWDANKPETSAPRITSLLRILVNRPSKAAKIEHVELQACNYEPYEDREDDPEGRPANPNAYKILASDRPAFEQDLMQMGLRDVSTWMSAIFVANDLRALMAVLLMRCTRLKSLNMASELFLTASSDLATWLPSMLDHCLSASASSDRDALSRFAHLTSVVITGPKTDAGRKLPTDLVKCLFRIPSLVTLDVACCTDFSTGIGQEVNPDLVAGCVVLDRLTVLRLPCSDAFPMTLKSLLQFTPNLRTLMYHVLMHAGAFPNDNLADALATAPKSLEDLTVRVHMYQREAADLSSLVYPIWPGGLGSLQHLRSLRSLTISLTLLFGAYPDDESVPQLADVLPQSLESLNLVGDLTAFDSITMSPYGHAPEAILRAFLTGEERVGQSWTHVCWQDECDRESDCGPIWACRGPPPWKSKLPKLSRLTVVENKSGYYEGDGGVIERDTFGALSEMVSGQGLELVYREVEGYQDLFC